MKKRRHHEKYVDPSDEPEIEQPQLTFKPNSQRQVEFFAASEYEVLFGGAAFSGKMQPLDAIVWTPFGPKLMGDIEIDDQVSNPDGSVARVIAAWDHGEKEIYRVTFDDESSCEVGLEHLWKVRQRAVGRFRKLEEKDRPTEWKVATTSWLIEEMEKGKKFCVPLTRPIDLTIASRNEYTRYPVRPYTLGGPLGDGHIGIGMSITTMDREIIDSVQLEGYSYSIKSQKTNNKASSYMFNKKNKTLWEGVRNLGLIGKRSWEKFIPKQYLIAPLEIRQNILRGLMDTDGYCDARGLASFTSTSEQLAKDVQFLARSLGFSAKITTKMPTFKYKGEQRAGRKAYNVWMRGMDRRPLFSLQRKLKRAESGNGKCRAGDSNGIVKIEFSRMAKARCITVNHPNGLYITDDFVVTHNSNCLVIDPLRYVAYSQFSAVIFRRTYPELLRSIMPYCQMYYQAAGGVYNEQKKRWSFPSGAYIDLGHMEHENDWTAFQGSSYTAHYYDELTCFHWNQYKMLAAWNRAAAGGIEAYRRSTSNPGGSSHSQVKQYFVQTCPPINDGELRYSELTKTWWQPVRPGPAYMWTDDQGRTLSRRFIPARVFDNEDGIRNNPNYITQLFTLDPMKRKAFLEGDWNVFEGQFFSDWNPQVHIIEPLKRDYIAQIPRYSIRGAIDYGNETVLEIGHRDYEGNIVQFLEVYSRAQVPTERADAMITVLQEYELFNFLIRYDTNMDYALQYYTGYDKAPIELFRQRFREKMGDKSPTFAVVSKKSEDNRKYRIACNEAFKQFIHHKMRAQDDPEYKTSPYLVRPKFYSTSNCTVFNSNITELMTDPDSPGGLDHLQGPEVPDHTKDACIYFFMDLQTPIEIKPQPQQTLEQFLFGDIERRLASGGEKTFRKS